MNNFDGTTPSARPIGVAPGDREDYKPKKGYRRDTDNPGSDELITRKKAERIMRQKKADSTKVSASEPKPTPTSVPVPVPATSVPSVFHEFKQGSFPDLVMKAIQSGCHTMEEIEGHTELPKRTVQKTINYMIKQRPCIQYDDARQKVFLLDHLNDQPEPVYQAPGTGNAHSQPLQPDSNHPEATKSMQRAAPVFAKQTVFEMDDGHSGEVPSPQKSEPASPAPATDLPTKDIHSPSSEDLPGMQYYLKSLQPQDSVFNPSAELEQITYTVQRMQEDLAHMLSRLALIKEISNKGIQVLTVRYTEKSNTLNITIGQSGCS